ncbi:MAG: hypothetical protein KDB00_04450 [Planctomycetales bacterium]|nr:hypothetical protein [Planctomycetales bacterium]
MFHRYAPLILILFGFLVPGIAPAQGQQLNGPNPAPQANALNAAQPPAAQPYRYWTSNWSLEDVQIGELVIKLRTIGIQLPVALKGQATVEFRVSVPVNALRTWDAYRFDGSLDIKNLVADQLQFDSVHADVFYRDGQLLLNQLRCNERLDASGKPIAGSGALFGNATAKLIPQGDFTAKVQTRDLALGPIAKLLSRFGFADAQDSIAGSLTTDVTMSGPVAALRQVERWTISGDLNAKGLRRGTSDGFELAANGFQWKDGLLQFSTLRIDSAKVPNFFIEVSGQVRLDEATTFEVNLTANDVPLGDVAFLLSPEAQSIVGGKLDAKGTATGTIGPSTSIDAIDIRMAVASPSVEVAGIQLGLLEHDIKLTRNHLSLSPRGQTTDVTSSGVSELLIQSLDFDYELTEQHASVKQLSAKVFGGDITGSVDFARDALQSHRLDVSWSDVRPQVKLALAGISPPPMLSLQSSGAIQWTVRADKVMDPAEHQATAVVDLTQIQWGTEVVGRADVNLRLDGGNLDVSLDGNVFGGTATIKTIAHLDHSMGWNDVPSKLQFTEFQLEGFSIGRLLKDFGIDRPRFDGRIGAAVSPVVSAIDGQPISLSGTARIDVVGLSADGAVVVRSLDLVARFDGDDFVLESGTGVYAGGQLDLDGQWSLSAGTKLLTVRLTRADGQLVLLPIGPDATQWVGGTVSGRATVVGQGDGWMGPIRISGSMSTENGTTFGMPVGDAHGPFTVVVNPSTLSWRATFPTIRSNLAKGRVSGNMVLQSAGGGRTGVHLDSQWRANHVDFESLLSRSIGTSTIGRGDLTGDFRLSGRNIRGINDLEGELRIRLGGTDATAVPGLSAAGSLLGATSLTGVRFEQGEVLGRIANGRLLLESISMVSDRVDVQASGSVGLVDRRLDIDAVISTGNFQGQNVLLGRIGTQALLDVVPIGQVNSLLSDRTIVVQMVGSARDPVIRLLAGETLRANAQRFARQRVFGIIAADSILNH